MINFHSYFNSLKGFFCLFRKKNRRSTWDQWQFCKVFNFAQIFIKNDFYIVVDYADNGVDKVKFLYYHSRPLSCVLLNIWVKYSTLLSCHCFFNTTDLLCPLSPWVSEWSTPHSSPATDSLIPLTSFVLCLLEYLGEVLNAPLGPLQLDPLVVVAQNAHP